MKYYDYHVHSNYSPDCNIPLEKMILSAIDKDVKNICITDHVDFDSCDPTLPKNVVYDVPNFSTEIDTLRKKFPQITIQKGVEIGIQKHIIKKCDAFVKSHDYDFVLCSFHTCSSKDLYTGEFYKGLTPKEAYEIYFEEMLYCINHFENFNVIGHLNILARYNKAVMHEDIMQYTSQLTSIFKSLIEKGKGIEVNTSSLRYSNKLLLTREVLELYHQLGGEIITVGSDSHVVETLTYGFDDVYKLLRQIGFKYITSFEKRQPKFHKIP